MSFGAGCSDLVLLLQTIYRVYDTIKNVPYEYQDLLLKFKDIENELNVLETRLKDIGRDKYGRFPGADDLRKDLENANKHLKQFESLSRQGLVKKIVQTSKFTFDSRRTKQYSLRMDAHRSRLHNFRQDVILQAALSHINTIRDVGSGSGSHRDYSEFMSTRASTSGKASMLSPDQVSVLTRAAKSVTLAKRLNMSTSVLPKTRLETIPSQSPEIPGPTAKNIDAAICNFVDNVVHQVESSKLYLQTAMPDGQIESFASIAAWFDTIQKIVAASPQPTSPSTDASKSPISNAVTLNELSLNVPIRSSDNDLSVWWSSLNFQGEDARSEVKESIMLNIDELSSIHSVVDDTHSSPQIINDHSACVHIDDHLSAVTERSSSPYLDAPAREIINISGALFMCSLTMGVDRVQCNLEISRSPGSTCIWATALERFIMTSQPKTLITGLTPQRHLDLSQSGPSHTPTRKALVLRHSVDPGLKCFPAVLHPTIEAEESNNPRIPYEIYFYESQFLDIEGKAGTAGRIDDYRYAFTEKEDRDKVRELIFGKKLLATAGYEESSASTCRIQTITLWKAHDPSEVSISVTLPHKSNNLRPPDKVIEVQVLGCENLIKATKAGQELKLNVRRMPESRVDNVPIQRRPSVATTNTTLSSLSKSRLSIRSRSSKPPSEVTETLRVKLSCQTSAERQDKKKFLETLARIFEPS